MQKWRTDPGPLLFSCVAVAAIFVVGLLLQFSQALNHDVGWLIVAARRLADGARVYADDVIEVNPPLILVLYVPSVWIARALDIGEIAAFRAYTGAAIAVSLWLCARNLRALFGSGDTPTRITLLVAIAFALWIPFHRSFGQREHWIALTLLPYLIAAAIRMVDRPLQMRWAVAAGAAGGIGFSIKPHYAIVFIALEALVALGTRSLRSWRRPEVLVAVAVGAVYISCVLVLLPSYLEFLVPLALDTYWAFQKPLATLLRWNELAVLGAVALATIVVGTTPARRALALVVGVAAITFFAAFMIQGVGWRYHLLPFGCAAIIMVSLSVADFVVGWRSGAVHPVSARGFGIGCGIATLALACVAAFPALGWRSGLWETLADGEAWRAGRSTGTVAQLTRVIENHAPGGTVYFFSSGLLWAFPTVNHAQVQWTSRFPNLWLLPPVIRARRDPEVSEALATRLRAREHYLIDSVVEDFRRRPPDLVFVDVSKKKSLLARARFEYLPYFLRDARFREIWSRFVRLGHIAHYVVYRRSAPTAASDRDATR